MQENLNDTSLLFKNSVYNVSQIIQSSGRWKINFIITKPQHCWPSNGFKLHEMLRNTLIFFVSFFTVFVVQSAKRVLHTNLNDEPVQHMIQYPPTRSKINNGRQISEKEFHILLWSFMFCCGVSLWCHFDFSWVRFLLRILVHFFLLMDVIERIS